MFADLLLLVLLKQALEFLSYPKPTIANPGGDIVEADELAEQHPMRQNT